MSSITKLFRLMEITRGQVQYGYALAEIPKTELSDLAQHHYLVTFITWRLCRVLRAAGIEINTEKAVEISLVHDLGELFGGDIAMPYAMENPAAREAAKRFEAENHRYLANFFEDDAEYFKELAVEAMQPSSLEAIVAKMADYVEVTHYKLYVHRLSKQDIVMVVNRLKGLVADLDDSAAQNVLLGFLDEWSSGLADGKLEEIFESSKK